MSASTLLLLRTKIRDQTHADETLCLQHLLENNLLTTQDRQTAERQALDVVEKCRENPNDNGLLDAFLLEYSLSTQEGVALMCLAEALLRVPDSATKDRLISEKILSGDWGSHRGQSENLFVNAATWGMILTGGLVRVDANIAGDPSGWLRTLVGRVGEPAVRFGVMQSMKLMGQQYVLGRNISSAIKRGKKDNPQGTRFSFDMLGEGARTASHAREYFDAYMNAIKTIGASNNSNDVFIADGISVKLTALHPRYEYHQRERVLCELIPLVTELAVEAKRYNIGFTIDAEEAARLDIELDIFEQLAHDPALANWDGLGFVLQAYQKRALAVADWLVELAKQSQRRIMVRLVKGAYWDAEIKHAQEMGYEDYPVFTRKANTDLSYQVCAARLLTNNDVVYPQFATHNAYTAVMILQLAASLGADGNFEFQRLHGMGDLLYTYLAEEGNNAIPLRVYAPVGAHADLLPYLVRRLLENGANCSFVNQFLDKNILAKEIVGRVEQDVMELPGSRHSKIPIPRDIFKFAGEQRDNSRGFDLDDPDTAKYFSRKVDEVKSKKNHAGPIISGRMRDSETYSITSPANRDVVVGHCCDAGVIDVEDALSAAAKAQKDWHNIGYSARALILNKAADIFEERTAELCALISLEAGRTLTDGVSEVREAVDFCRYYSLQFCALQVDTRNEHAKDNQKIAQGRGVFVCISPWNFPLAIFVGQIAAALVTGNTVIAKPAEQSPLIAAVAVAILHQAGVPVEVLHMLCGTGAKLGPLLLADKRVAGVAFTGSSQTAKRIQANLLDRDGEVPPLIAETGGQNVMIVDSTALHEQVVDDVIQSAFLSAGQRCSALRVLFVQDDVADNVIAMLKGAIEFLNIGEPWKLSSDIGPVIDAQALDVLNAHVSRMHKESIFIGSAKLSHTLPSGHYFKPHIFEIDSMSRLTDEVFGPILHVIRYQSSELNNVIKQINDSGYGLTLGVHSRLNSFTDEVFNETRVGNTYVNRNMVGAVVGVNPFGGQGLSGTGFKAGGPHYLLRFCNLWASNNSSFTGEKVKVTNLSKTNITTKNQQLAINFERISQVQQTWNHLSGEKRLDALKNIVTELDQPLLEAKVYDATLEAYVEYIFNELINFTSPIHLPGPTGESNQLSLGGRGIFLLVVYQKDFEHNFLLSLAALAAGNALVIVPCSDEAINTAQMLKTLLSHQLPEHLITADFEHRNIESLIANRNVLGVTAYHQAELIAPVVKREGAIIPFVECLSRKFILLPFASEKTKTNNVVATGGNAFLLNLTEERSPTEAEPQG